MRPMSLAAATFLLLLAVPLASAGTADAPEVTDDAGDCEVAIGNEYADIVGAWISDETATSFNVNLALAKWTDPAAQMSGYTVQFTHQGTQFGVVALYTPDGWEYANGYIDMNTGESSNFTESPGSFTPGTPAVLMVTFDKANFVHTSATDNELRDFQAGTADFKFYAAFGIAGQAPPAESPYFICDFATSTATYAFSTGGHSMHSPGSGAGASNATAPTNSTASASGSSSAAAPVDAASAPDGGSSPAETPAPGAIAMVAALVVGAVIARRCS